MIYLRYCSFFPVSFFSISHLSLPEDMKSCGLKFLDIAASDKNAWQRRSFLSLLRGRGFLFFFSVVSLSIMVMTGFVRRARVYTWKGGRNFNEYKSLLLELFLPLFLSRLFPASLPFFLFCMVRGHWYLVLCLIQKAYEKLAFSSFLFAHVSFGTTEYTQGATTADGFENNRNQYYYRV